MSDIATMGLPAPLRRFPDAGSLQSALNLVESGRFADPAVGTACAWYLRQSHTARAVELAHSLIAGPPAGDAFEHALNRGYLHLVLADAACLSADLVSAQKQIEAARACFAELPECCGHSDVDWVEANLASDSGNLSLREKLMRRSLTTAQSLGDEERVALGQLSLACFDAFKDIHAAAASWNEQVEPLLDSPYAAVKAIANYYRFLSCNGQGNATAALEHAVIGQRAAEECGMQRRAIVDAANVASVLMDLGDLDGALQHLEDILPRARALGWPHSLSFLLTTLSHVMLRLGRVESAREMADEAVSTLSELPKGTHYIAATFALGDALLACDDMKRARDCFAIVSAPDSPSEFPYHWRYGRLGLARLCERTNDLDQAHDLCLQVLDAPEDIADYALHIDALRLLSRVLERRILNEHGAIRTDSPASCGADPGVHSSPSASEDPVRILRQAISLSDQFLDGTGRHALLTDLSACLEIRGLHSEALEALKAAMSSLAAEKAQSASRQSLALEVRFRTEQAIAQAELQRKVACEAAQRAVELEAMNRKVNEAMQALQQAQAQLVERNAELKAANERISDLSLTDPLTGLRNRRFLDQVIESAVAESLRSYSPNFRPSLDASSETGRHDIVFFLLDMDHFKKVNDGYGHPAGDAVLVELANRLRTVTREQDFLVRWGGEEFLVAVRGIGRSEAPAIAERLRLSVSNSAFNVGAGRMIAKTVSIGFASFPIDPQNPTAGSWQQAVELADARLLTAKRNGRDRWVGDPGMLAAHAVGDLDGVNQTPSS